ncbi:cache domain-containing protein, partial [Campylobacter majalis]|uniref:cache domain-containing protein n=1 Tax=Campylobacter majalis TaxID=2790656 RepID=UPI003D69D913
MKKVANKIAIIILVLLSVAFIVFSSLSYFSSKDNTIELVKSSKQSMSVSIDVFIRELMGTKFIALDGFESYIKNHPEMLFDREVFKQELARMSGALDVDEIYMGFADDGEMITSEVKQGQPPKIVSVKQSSTFDARRRGWYERAMQNPGKTIFSDPYMTTSGNLAIAIAKPLSFGGRTYGVIAVDIYLTKVDEALRNIKDTENAYGVLIDMNKKVFISHRNKDFILSENPEPKSIVNAIMAGYSQSPESGFIYNGKGNTDRVGACEKYDQANWLVCSASPMSDYEDMLNKALINQIIT